MWDSVGVDCHMGKHWHKEHQQTARKMSAQEKARTIMKNNVDKFAKRKGRCGVLWSFNSMGKKPVFTQSMSNLSMPWLLFNHAPNLNFHMQAAQRRHQRGGLFEAHAAHQSQEQQPYLAWVVPAPNPSCIDKLCKEMCLPLRFCHVLSIFWGPEHLPSVTHPAEKRNRKWQEATQRCFSSAALEQSHEANKRSTFIAVYNAYLDYALLHGHQETVFETF